MIVFVNEQEKSVSEDTTLAEAVARFSPYGDEPVLVLMNGERMDSSAALPLQDRAKIAVYPRLIGG